MHMLSIAYTRRWLAEWKALWLSLLACLVAIAVVVISITLGPVAAERAARLAGLVLQLAAIATAVAALVSARRQFGRPTIFATLLAWWERRPWKTREPTILSGNSSMGDMTATGRFYPWHAVDPSHALPDQIKALEQNVTMLHTLWKEDAKANSIQFRELKQALADETAKISSQVAIAGAQVERFAVGGVAFASAGLLCAVIGTLLGALAPELAVLPK